MTQHFDVAVIGGQTAGVVTAALLAKRGKRVVLLDHGESITHYRRHGLCMPLTPALVPMFEGSPVMQKVHTELGLGPDLRTSTTVLKPGFQAIMPDQRIDVPADREAFLAELSQEFPNEIGAMKQVFERLYALDEEISAFLSVAPPMPPSGLIERFKTRKIFGQVAHLAAPFAKAELLQGLPVDHPLIDLLLGPLTFFAHLDPDAASTLHAVRMLARYFDGVVGFADPLGGLYASLLKAAKHAGVDMHRGTLVKAVNGHGRHLEEIEAVDLKDTFTADYFVAATRGPFHELLPPGRLQMRYASGQQAAKPLQSLLVLNLLVRRAVMPKAMANAVFLLNGRRQPRGQHPSDPPLFLQRFPALKGEPGQVHGNEALEVPDQEIVCVACPVAATENDTSADRLALLKHQMIERVNRLVPFLRDYLDDASLAVDKSSWDADNRLAAAGLDPWSMHPIFSPKIPPFLGIAVRPLDTVYTNLFHCGVDVVPGLGIEGEYLSATGVAQRIGERTHKQVRR